VKPDNILLARVGERALVTAFGVACAYGRRVDAIAGAGTIDEG
jgi:hypothetical protein